MIDIFLLLFFLMNSLNYLYVYSMNKRKILQNPKDQRELRQENFVMIQVQLLVYFACIFLANCNYTILTYLITPV